MQKTASIRPRGGLTLYVFLLTSCRVYPTWLGRARTERKQQQHDSVVQGPRAIIAPRAVRLILSGIPLSLTSLKGRRVELICHYWRGVAEIDYSTDAAHVSCSLISGLTHVYLGELAPFLFYL